MSIPKPFVLGLFVCLLAAVPAGQAWQDASQTAPSAVVAGTVADRSGGVIPGATVTLAQGASVLATRITDTQGAFRFDAIRPGTYRIRAMLAGFKTTVGDFVVSPQMKTATLRVIMEVGALSESVTATADASGQGAGQIPYRNSIVNGLPQAATNITIDGVASRNALNAVTFLPGSTTDQFFAVLSPRADAIEEVAAGEAYAPIAPNPFLLTSDAPLSTFAADVDTASYTNVRRFLSKGQLPPPDAVRIEELVNYFRFAYQEPRDGRPVSITTEIGDCPWAPGHQLALVGLRARAIDDRDAPPRNLTLLLDVSGSMEPAERLPLIKTALRMFVDTLRDEDRIAIVVYASATGLVLPATAGDRRERIHDAIENLSAGGSTNGAAGLQLAYQVARQNFVAGGINRVILATDGDFNVGLTSHEDLLALIERERASGVFLSVLGVGSGNLKDATMELLADKGNGHYAYLDSLQEARRVLVREGGATLETVAKDVKLQVEFNPTEIAAYRLIGYENRMLAARDFNDDTKDAGEMGAGHTVTALYELVPANVALPKPLRAGRGPSVDPLRYQSAPQPTRPARSGEVLTVKVRYKQPDAQVSQLIEQPLRAGRAPTHLPLAAVVAEFGLLLRDRAKNADRWSALAHRARSIGGTASLDRDGLVDLVETAASLKAIVK
jgi:Ca-activated chloride channel family protein